MNIKLYQNKRGKPEVYKVQGFLEEILTNSGDSGDTIKELKQLLDNQSRALSLIITKSGKMCLTASIGRIMVLIIGRNNIYANTKIRSL
jgi:hypothetical protein